MAEPVRLVVAGHTNTGKTSLLRTLTRDSGFGEVAERPGTTRHIESAALLAHGQVEVILHDTPGMEDSIELLALLDELVGDRPRPDDGPERIARFLAHPAAQGRFEQEAKVLRQMLACDAALYVIDARDPVLAKHRDELTILACCGRPLLPVLNFVADESQRGDAWRAMLARIGLHAVVAFDTVAPEVHGERRLFGALAALLEPRRGHFERLIAARAQEAQARHHASLRLVAELLLDVAACREKVAARSESAASAALADLRERVRVREQQCIDALLALYRFRPATARAGELPLLDGRWELDLFEPEALREAGIQIGTGAAAGAAAGVGIDLVTGGLTLGAAAAIGALAGGLWQTVDRYGERLFGRLRGARELTVDDAILRLLALRALRLVAALERRGHAAQAPLDLSGAGLPRWRDARLPELLHEARAHPEWSALTARFAPDRAREQAVALLAAELATAATPPA